MSDEIDDDNAPTRLRSLLTELWDGVRAHGLQAPAKGREGERLIHAYCGGIAKLRNELEDARSQLAALTAERDALKAALGDVEAMREEVLATAREEGRAAGAEEMRARCVEIAMEWVLCKTTGLAESLAANQIAGRIRSLATTPAPEPAAPTPGEGKP